MPGAHMLMKESSLYHGPAVGTKENRFLQFWLRVLVHYDTEVRYYHVLKLGLVVLLFMLDTSCCERGYALMNRVHSVDRSTLVVETVNDIMACCELGPEIADFDPKPVLEAWLLGPLGEKSKRGRYLHGKLKAVYDSIV